MKYNIYVVLYPTLSKPLLGGGISEFALAFTRGVRMILWCKPLKPKLLWLS